MTTEDQGRGNHGDTWSLANGDGYRVIVKGWHVFDGELADIVDAPTRGKALFASINASECYDSVWDLMHSKIKVRRRKDLDGLKFMDARYVIWPCKQRPCPGCTCCETGFCEDEDDD